MGCDIHTVVEIKTKWGWEFVHKTEFDNNGVLSNYYFPDFRNYEIFGFLAGVRIADPTFGPISKPRGFPKECSYEVEAFKAEDSMLLGDHSYSYVTLAEMMAPYASITMRKAMGYDIPEDQDDIYSPYIWFHDNILTRLAELVEFTDNNSYDEVRIVFGFDS